MYIQMKIVFLLYTLNWRQSDHFGASEQHLNFVVTAVHQKSRVEDSQLDARWQT